MQILSVALVVDAHAVVSSAGADGKSIHAVVGLSPPAIEDRKIQSAIQDNFLTAGARCFQGTAGIVQPDIDALHEIAPDIDVIVFDKDELVGKQAVAHEFGDLLQYFFARLVVGMGLTSKDELHRAFGIVHHGGEALEIGEDQVGALVGGEAAGKSDGQRVWTEHLAESRQNLARFEAALGLFDGAAADELEKLGLQAEMCLPEFAVVDVLNALPNFGVAAVLVPVGAEVAVVEPEHLRGQPGWNVNSIGDVSDGNFVFGLAGTKTGPHGTGEDRKSVV